MHTLTKYVAASSLVLALVGCSAGQPGIRPSVVPSVKPTQEPSVLVPKPTPTPTVTPIPVPCCLASQSPTPIPTPTSSSRPEPQPSRPANLAEGLVAHYAFENNLNSHDGLRNGVDPPEVPDIELDPADYPPGYFPGSWKYSNTPPIITGYYSGGPTQAVVDDPSILNIKQDLTFSFWYRLNPIQSNDIAWPILSGFEIDSSPFALFWTPGGAELILNKGTSDEFWVNRLKEPNFNLMQRGVWQHWVATYDSSKVKIYLNGKLNFEATYNKPLIPSSKEFPGYYIGRSNLKMYEETGALYMDTIQGNLDELRIYNRALKPEEVEQLYQFK